MIDPVCPFPGCYRGAVGSQDYQFKDGPCERTDCQWEGPTRPHFTDTPSTPIVDAGAQALNEKKQKLAALARARA